MENMEKEGKKEIKRLFFGFEVIAPWPEKLPKGRAIQEDERHLTVAFMGETDYARLLPLLVDIPLPPFKMGMIGEFDSILFLPPRHPRVAAWHVSWLENPELPASYSRILIRWLKEHGFQPDESKDFLPHVTISRAPFDHLGWQKNFHKLPMMIKSLHLYESLGQLSYKPLWTHDLLLPFEEIEHAADIAFHVRGETAKELFIHAAAALAFKCPELVRFRKDETSVKTIDEVVITLNQMISSADAEVGIPMKAVSFHGEIKKDESGAFCREMIIDV